MRKADDVLETYLAQLVGGAPVLASDSGLQPMLQVAMQLRQVGRIAPSPARVERIRVALRRVPAREVGASSTTARPGLWRRPVAGLAFAMMLMALGTTSALAAPSALPDSPLYPVRNMREAVQVQLAGTAAQRAMLYANFAAERATQLRGLVGHKDVTPGVVVTLLQDITSRVHQANQEARDNGPAARSAVSQVEGQIGDQLSQIQQEGEFSGNDGAQLSDTLRDVQSGQSGPSGPSGQSDGNSNSDTNQP
ncbi:MAG TPA: DUF5667 domain-containing protein [Candidatus Dormibacteraeota bacterium]|nr:DUF5667 domain-containing protein [Candidatus Dormibacteraeota bacterium]